jgi:hypothetical protein
MKNLSPKLLLLLALFSLPACVVPLKVPPIQPGAEKPSIDFKHLAEFAEAAGHAYDADDVIIKAYGEANVVVHTLPNADGHYFVFFDHKARTQTIAIRGTASKLNAQVDLESIKVFDDTLKIFVHAGFKRAADELYTDLKPVLQPDYTTRITGHSLGGALACLTMMHLMHDGVPVDQVITFGQPKVTNEQGGTAYPNDRYFRVINNRDLVAQVPPSNVVYDLSGAYQHFGPEITLLPDNTWTYSPAHIPLDYVTKDNWKNLELENGTDHQIANYISRIKAIK